MTVYDLIEKIEKKNSLTGCSFSEDNKLNLTKKRYDLLKEEPGDNDMLLFYFIAERDDSGEFPEVDIRAESCLVDRETDLLLSSVPDWC